MAFVSAHLHIDHPRGTRQAFSMTHPSKAQRMESRMAWIMTSKSMARNLPWFVMATCFSKLVGFKGVTMDYPSIVSKTMGPRRSFSMNTIRVCYLLITSSQLNWMKIFQMCIVKALNPRYLKWHGMTSSFTAEFSFDSMPDEMFFGTGQHQVRPLLTRTTKASQLLTFATRTMCSTRKAKA